MADARIFLFKNKAFKDTFSAQEKEVRNTLINTGNRIYFSIKELTEQLKRFIGCKGNVNFLKPNGAIREFINLVDFHALCRRLNILFN